MVRDRTVGENRIGLELRDGQMVGRDPSAMTTEELRAAGHRPKPILRALRERCIDCCAGSVHEVRVCPVVRCPSWPYRMGTNVFRKPMSEAQRLASAERMRRTRAAQIAAGLEPDEIDETEEDLEQAPADPPATTMTASAHGPAPDLGGESPVPQTMARRRL